MWLGPDGGCELDQSALRLVDWLESDRQFLKQLGLGLNGVIVHMLQ